METTEAHRALIVTENAKDNTVDNCEIHGGAEIAGQGNKFSRTKILSWAVFFICLGTAANATDLYQFFLSYYLFTNGLCGVYGE